MTRQEFTAAVRAVQAGEPGATLKLWEGARHFVAKSAHRWARNSNGRTPHEDLIQAGFLAVLDAVERFDPEREDGSFLSVLRLTLKSRFAEESGIRTTRRDVLQYAESMDAPAYEDGPAVEDTVPDRAAPLSGTVWSTGTSWTTAAVSSARRWKACRRRKLPLCACIIWTA